MVAQAKLPPGRRDFEVFEAVVVGGQRTRDAAARFKLSQTRICQVVQRVRRWQAEVVPAANSVSEERLLRVAKHVAVSRIDYLYGEMLEAWRRSQGEVKKTRSARYGDDVTTTFVSSGDPKYLLAAMRLAKAQAELGIGCIAIYAASEDAAEDDDSIGDEATSDPEPQATAPPRNVAAAGATSRPIEDCSDERGTQALPTPDANSPAVANPSVAKASSELTPRQAAARRQLFAPVQPARKPAGSIGLNVTPDQLGLSVEEILAPRARRSRRAG